MIKMRDKDIWKILAISVAFVIVASSVAIFSAANLDRGISENGIDEGGGKGVIPLEMPSFIGVAGASEVSVMREGTNFLEEEAGISAYTNVGETIDLEKAKTAFRTIEYETTEYVIGSVPLPDYAETEDVHAYVHKDGWVVTYYLKEEPVAKIVDWEDYSTDERIKGTKLEDGISVVCNAAGVPIRDLKYYNFRYANADTLMIIADALWGSAGPDTFNIKLPSDFVFYERSFSHYFSGCYADWSHMYIDGDKISYIGSVGGTNYGLLSSTKLSLDTFHTIKIVGEGNPYSGGNVFGTITLTYREV
jgi:hypothetical protein